jgi:NAD(P)-dependent dehydrogenase (short-subunit alcohol dehydrogenase family)
MKKNILVTGTNSGFGHLIVRTLARQGHQVFATMREVGGRNRQVADEFCQLARSEKLSIDVIEMELGDDTSVQTAVTRVIDQAGPIDVAVNNAGLGLVGLEEGHRPEQIIDLFNINVVGPHRVAKAVLPGMRLRRSGLLITVSSGLGRFTLPLMAAYCASKAALEALFDGYRYELKPTGVESVIVQPGAFPTGFVSRHSIGEDHKHVSAGYGPLENALQQMFEGLSMSMKGPHAPDPQQVADAVLQIVESPAGSRPDRVVVDPMTGSVTEALNKAHSQAQREALGAGGMGMLI